MMIVFFIDRYLFIKSKISGRGGLCTILRYPFLATDSKILLKDPSVPIHTNFEGGGRAETMRFFFGPNCPKSALKFFPAAQKIRPKQRLFSFLGGLEKLIGSTKRKGRQNFQKILKIRRNFRKSDTNLI